MPYRPAYMRLLHAALLLLTLSLLGAGGPAARANWLFSYPPNQVTLDSGHRNNVFTVGDPIQFSLTIFNYGTYVSPGTVRYEVRDYWGNVAASGTVPAPIPNSPIMLSLPTITQPGWYKLYLHQSTPIALWGDSMGGTMFVIFRPNANFPAEPNENLPNNSGGSDGGDEVARGVLGMGPQRHPVPDASQPAAAIASIGPAIAQDKQYYTPYDPQRPRPLLIAFPNGVGSSSAAQQAANLAGLTQIVTQFHQDVKYWEPLNEPQATYSPTDYINKELIPFYKTVKAVDPTCKVLGPGIVTIGPGGLSWIEGFLQAGGAKYIDAFSFHAYNNVNGDLTLARESLDNLNALLTKYGVGSIEKWQTEQGYFAACYGAYQPRLQGRWTMLQMMVYEQYGIPKEHNHLWYDKSHGFWDFPAFWENEDGLYSYGSFDPAAPLMRVWSEELYGTNFQSAYNLGALGNKLYVGSLFGGPGRQIAAFQSSGRTDGSLTLNVTGGTSIHVVSAFGVASDLPVTAGQAVLPVPEIPVYVELAPGQTVQPVPVDYGTNLALTPGTVAAASGSGLSPLNPSYPNDISKVINGTLENWYYNQGNGDHPWMGNDASLPGWVQITLPNPMVISHAVVYAGVPWQSDGSLLDYELQYDQNGVWVTLSHPVEPTHVVDFFTSTVFCTADSFYSDRDVFVHDFAPVTTQKIRLLVHDVTDGGAPTQDIVEAGGQPGPHQMTLREIELYGPSGQTAPPIIPVAGNGTGLLGQYYSGVSLTTLAHTEVDPTINFNLSGTAPVAPLTPYLYSVRWTGQVQPLYSETYTFSTVSDDGIRVWVNGQETINNWTDHPPTANAGTITLAAGQKYSLKVEYYQRNGGAEAKLSWSSPSQTAQIIPQSQLYPAAAPAPSPVLTSITVSPAAAALNTGAAQQFTAVANDQNGSPLSPQPAFTWSVAAGSVGTVSAGGLYSAGATAGSATVQAASGSVHGTAAVTVTAPAPTPGTGSVKFFPRPTCANRMQGGQFQGSMDGTTYTTLYTIISVPADGQWTTAPLPADPKAFRYLRYVSPSGGWGNVSEIAFYSGTGSSAVKLTGTPFGSPGSYNNTGNTFDKAFDGDTTTYFDGPGPNGNDTGIDQGSVPAPAQALVYQISAGGPSAAPFAADAFVQGGSTDTVSASTAIDTSAAASPAPQAVYQSERWGNFTYTLPNLTPGASYTLRLHFAEIYFGPGLPGGGGAGSRLFNVAVNGASALSNFDIFAAAGGADKAVVKTFPVTANASGTVTVAFTTGNANFPKLSGLELLH